MDYIIERASKEDKKEILEGLLLYNEKLVPDMKKSNFRDLSLVLKDKSNKVLGGVVARLYGGSSVHVETFWIDESVRGTGYGSKIFGALEESAKKAGATLIHLDTFDFQARGFYEKLGYKVFGILEDSPLNHKLFFLQKRLS